MASTFQTNAIVLRRKDFREKDRLVTFFTEDYGKIQGQAISARKFESKLAGHLEPFVHTRIHIANGRRIDKIAGSVTVDSFSNLRKEPIGVSLASYVGEIVDAFTHEHQTDRTIYYLLLETLHAYEGLMKEKRARRSELTVIADRFLLRFVAAYGFHLNPHNCSTCGDILGNESTFLPSQGIQCTKHTTTFERIPISTRDRELLDQIGASSAVGVLGVQMSEDEHHKIHRMFATFLTYHFERRLRSEPFVRQLFL